MGLLVAGLLLVLGFGSLGECLYGFLQVQASDQANTSKQGHEARMMIVIYSGCCAVLFVIAGLMLLMNMLQ
ncbi:hypothetical protein [Lacticaseibacillus jixiensis]|uniref:hypothetical protein n=1 Tax=Lacticaseibacillus jixiensis TaxID=3231926 RepID=UPI0036F38F96